MEASSTLMTGDPEHDRIVSAVTSIFSLRDDQIRSKQAGQRQDAEEKKAERKKRITFWITIATIVFGGGGGGGAWYLQQIDTSEISNEEAIRRHDVDGRLKTEEIKSGMMKTQIDDFETDFDDHLEEQRKVNEAAKLSGVRQEVMLEQLLRARGRNPPSKPQAQRDAQMAIGIDPDDPLGEP